MGSSASRVSSQRAASAERADGEKLAEHIVDRALIARHHRSTTYRPHETDSHSTATGGALPDRATGAWDDPGRRHGGG